MEYKLENIIIDLPKNLKWGKYNSHHKLGTVCFWTVINLIDENSANIINQINKLFYGRVIPIGKDLFYIIVDNIRKDPGFDIETDYWKLSKLEDHIFIEICDDSYVSSIYKPVFIYNPEEVVCQVVTLREKITNKSFKSISTVYKKIQDFDFQFYHHSNICNIYTLTGEKGRKIWAEACNSIIKDISYDKSLVKGDIDWELDEDINTCLYNIKQEIGMCYGTLSKKDEEIETIEDLYSNYELYTRMLEQFISQFK